LDDGGVVRDEDEREAGGAGRVAAEAGLHGGVLQVDPQRQSRRLQDARAVEGGVPGERLRQWARQQPEEGDVGGAGRVEPRRKGEVQRVRQARGAGVAWNAGPGRGGDAVEEDLAAAFAAVVAATIGRRAACQG
jgi:hypothetical protein